MARNIPVGNGRLLACFDDEYCMRDLYFPHVGQENHLGGNHGRFGVWVEGAFSWVGPDWERDLRYEDDTLVTRVRLRNETLGLAIECRDTASRHLWREEHNRFYRGLYRDDQGKLEVDMTADASLWGLFAFGLYSVQDPRIEKTMTALRERLWVKTAVGGMARHEDDDYYRSTQEATGNPWFVCTLWLDNYLVERAGDETEIEEALKTVLWIEKHALPSGVLSEQVHPITGEPLSVSPLTWSHATLVATTQRILKRFGEMKMCPSCGLSLVPDARKMNWMERLCPETCFSIHSQCDHK